MAEQQLSATAQWAFDSTAVPVPVNQFIFQGGLNLVSGESAGEVYMMLGHATPPPIDPASIPPEVLENGLVLNVVSVGQFSISIGRLRELHAALSEFLASSSNQG